MSTPLPEALQNKKILFICNEFPAPSETFISLQIECLLELGLEIGVLAGKPSEVKDARLLKLLGHPGLKVYYHPHVPEKKLARAAGCLINAVATIFRHPSRMLFPGDLRRFRASSLAARIGYLPMMAATREDLRDYTLAHAHFGMCGEEFLFYQAKKFVPDIPFVVSFHGCDVTHNPRKYGRDVYAEVIARAKLLTVNSTYTKGLLLAIGGPEEKIMRLRAFVDTDKLVFKERTRPAGEPVRLLAIGRLEEMKGHTYLIEACRLLKDRQLEFELKIAGGGSLLDELQRQVADSGLTKEVRLLNWQNRDEVRALLDWAHVFVMPSVTASDGNTETQGVALQEAQGSGLPVVATDHDGFPESLLPDVSGYLVPERSAAALADALQAVIARAPEWPVIGKAGHDFVKREFEATVLTRQLLDVYERLCA